MLPTGNCRKRRRSAEAQTSAGCQLREQASAATTVMRSSWEPEPDGDAGDRAGGGYAQDRVLRV